LRRLGARSCGFLTVTLQPSGYENSNRGDAILRQTARRSTNLSKETFCTRTRVIPNFDTHVEGVVLIVRLLWVFVQPVLFCTAQNIAPRYDSNGLPLNLKTESAPIQSEKMERTGALIFPPAKSLTGSPQRVSPPSSPHLASA